MKYIKDWRLFESEYWDKVLRLRALGLSNEWADQLIDWLDKKQQNPTQKFDSLDLTGCNLKELPPDLNQVNSYVIIKDSLIETLPDRMVIGKSLWISDCPELRQLPTELVVGENLSITRCPKLETLPASLQVGKDLNVIDAPIRTLPQQAWIQGRATLMDTFISRNEFTDWVRETGALEPFCMGHDGPKQGVRETP
jgi:hypothetical protein